MLKDEINAVLQGLTEREEKVLRLRFGLLDGRTRTLEEVGKDTKSIKPVQLIESTEPNYWVFGVLCENKSEALQEFRRRGWYATGVHINNNIYSIFKDSSSLKGVNEFVDKFLALPCGWWINRDEKEVK